MSADDGRRAHGPLISQPRQAKIYSPRSIIITIIIVRGRSVLQNIILSACGPQQPQQQQINVPINGCQRHKTNEIRGNSVPGPQETDAAPPTKPPIPRTHRRALLPESDRSNNNFVSDTILRLSAQWLEVFIQ